MINLLPKPTSLLYQILVFMLIRHGTSYCRKYCVKCGFPNYFAAAISQFGSFKKSCIINIQLNMLQYIFHRSKSGNIPFNESDNIPANITFKLRGRILLEFASLIMLSVCITVFQSIKVTTTKTVSIRTLLGRLTFSFILSIVCPFLWLLQSLL